ncbi:MAG: hypothetical protein ACI3W7_02700 [Oscillospiraceae bacterium]
MKRKAISVIAMLLLMASFLAIPAAAAGEPTDSGISPYYNSLTTIMASISISDAGKAACNSYAKVNPTTNSVSLAMTLQRYTGGSWTYVTSWSTSGTGSVSLDKSYYITHGYYYRVKGVATVYSSSGAYVEQVTIYSDSEYY